MADHIYRWSVLHAVTRILGSLLGWTLIIGLPGLFAWASSLGNPVRERLVALGIVGVFFMCLFIHSRKYWRRLFDRSAQLELHSGYLRAKQLGDDDILWDNIVEIHGQETAYDDFSYLVLNTSTGVVELDIAGLNARMCTIFETAERMWRERAQTRSRKCLQ